MRSHINKTLRREIFDEFSVGPNSATYGSDGSVITNPNQRRKKNAIKILKVAIPIASILLVLAAIIYLPQFFVKDNVPNELIFKNNKAQYNSFEKFLKNNASKDYDGDGLTNSEESQYGTNPFSVDTDRDGVSDAMDIDKLNKNDTLHTALLTQGDNIKDPYEINGVILWPDTDDVWALGAVIPIETGYQFTNYKGWAKFPSGKYAYQYVDGKHSLLRHKESANAWYIERDCVVVLVDKKPENTHKISFFGHSTYMRGGFGSFLSALLPARGWITGETMWLDDTFVDTRANVYAKYQKASTENLPESRFSTYSEELSDLAEVYTFIDEGKCVMASMMSPTHGEVIVEVYGYTADGDLLVADPQVKSMSGSLKFQICCSRAISKDNKIVERSWFEFYGCGFDSHKGDLIGFYSVLGGGNK